MATHTTLAAYRAANLATPSLLVLGSTGIPAALLRTDAGWWYGEARDAASPRQRIAYRMVRLLVASAATVAICPLSRR